MKRRKCVWYCLRLKLIPSLINVRYFINNLDSNNSRSLYPNLIPNLSLVINSNSRENTLLNLT